MATNEFLKKIRTKAKQNKRNRADLRFRKAIALFKAKGLLKTNLEIPPATGMRLDLRDALWAGRNVEPRILEVLPAALLHHRANFLGLQHIPQELEEVLQAIRLNADKGPDFEGIEFTKMKHWANARLKDRRTKPSRELRQAKTYRLPLSAIKKLQALVAAGKFKDQTGAIEAAIEQLRPL